MSKFDKRTGDYVDRSDPLGRAVDSLMQRHVRHSGTTTTIRDYGSPLDAVPHIYRKAQPGEILHPIHNLTTQEIVDDLERVIDGRRPLTEFVRTAFAAAGYDPDQTLDARARMRVRNEIVKDLRRRIREREEGSNLDSTFECLLVGKSTDPVLWASKGGRVSTTVGQVRDALGMSVEEFLSLPKDQKTKVIKRTGHRLRAKGAHREVQVTGTAEDRSRLHSRLRGWARGDLRLERPQGSSLHHLVDYDASCGGNFAVRAADVEDYQVVVVEHDWGRAVPPVLGEWRLPYPLMVWEFRISGVRVMAFVDCVEDGHSQENQMWLVYGADGHWVLDDYYYVVGDPTLPAGIPHRKRGDARDVRGDQWEFRRVATMAYDCIRAVCIMMDAQVAQRQSVPAPDKLARRRKAEGRAPLRDHYVVRLLNQERRAHYSRPRVAGRLTDVRAPQRGHWRRGTWVHFDDPDSGEVQYPNDGGFIVSKTWRRWHFAGDPNNIIHRELRA